uniref:discoidin domain-containing protein n=1 Tax=uncultured Draconibacterium sp. TaxID=1573823 RepID=UPI0032168AF2
MTGTKTIVLFILGIFAIACKQPLPPEPYGPVPTENQVKWHEMEYYSLICFGLNTYTRQEWGYGDVDPKVFNPSDLDTDQWCQVAKEAGMKGMILVAKHHDGFCLWPSKTTDYTVAATPWKDGKGDVLGDLAQSCKKYGLKLGVYISPWDRNHAEYGRRGYVEAYHKQWEEVLEYSDDIFEAWFDGANGGTGYYGGAREKRKIEKGYYQFPKIFKLIKDRHPNAVLFGYVEDVTKDVIRWGGTEEGTGSATNWCRYNDVTSTNWEVAKTGVKDGKYWMPVEGNTTILHPKKWYYNESSKPRTLKNFVDLYYSTIGQNATFVLGLSIGPDGQIPERDVKSMLAQKKQLDKELATNLAKNITIKADDYRAKSFAPKYSVDGSTTTYWATNDGVRKASIVLDFKKETTFNRLLLQEYIRLGQRIHKFVLEVDENNDWKKVAEGTTIGYKRILRFDNTKAAKVRITLETDASCITLSNIEIYNAPALVADPVPEIDIEGNVSFSSEKGVQVYYALGENPDSTEFIKYSDSLLLPGGGVVQAYAIDKSGKIKSEVVTKEWGIAKNKWKIHSCSGEQSNNGKSEFAIDRNLRTSWMADNKKSKTNFISIDLGEEINLAGFSYMPDIENRAGAVYEYEFYTSTNGINWGEPVSKGEFSNIENNPVEQVIKFEKNVKARFVKLVSISVAGNSEVTSIAEVDLFADSDFRESDK